MNRPGLHRTTPYIGGLLLVMACACSEHTPTGGSLAVTEILGGVPPQGFSVAEQPIAFEFPRDHGAHPAFRNEWWYFTGNVADRQGQRYGYQLTFFRYGLVPPAGRTELDSHWSQYDIWMAHLALTDAEDNRHYHRQKLSRGAPGMAGAIPNPLRVWLDDWQLSATSHEFPWQLKAGAADFSVELTLMAIKPPVLQGDRGLSRKSARPGNASYYYSFSRLHTEGVIRIDGAEHPVHGLSWFDREWGTSALDEDQQGWDWFSLQLEDGRDIMYYQLRNKQGLPHPSSQGKLIGPDGVATSIMSEEVDLQVLQYWEDDTRTRYPVEWQIHYRTGDEYWKIRPLVKAQLMDTSVKYWEGAVEVTDITGNELLGRGYLEMTGY